MNNRDAINQTKKHTVGSNLACHEHDGTMVLKILSEAVETFLPPWPLVFGAVRSVYTDFSSIYGPLGMLCKHARFYTHF